MTKLIRWLVMPFLLHRAKRRSKRDNRFTQEQLEFFHSHLKSRKS